MNAHGTSALPVAVIIPALNEAQSLPGVLRAIPASRIRYLIVVDNGSTDDTAEVARSCGATVVTATTRGYGSACLAGLAHLAELPTPPAIVAFLDGDQSDDPSQLPVILDPILEGEADMVLGLRQSGAGGRSAVPLHARIGNACVLRAARVLFGARFADLGPFRAIAFAALQSLEMDDRNWGWTVQMQIRAARAGLRIQEVPVDHRPRAAGRSKVSGSVRGSVAAGSKMLYTLLRERFRPPPGTR